MMSCIVSNLINEAQYASSKITPQLIDLVALAQMSLVSESRAVKILSLGAQRSLSTVDA